MKKGISLTEILVVIAILLIIAAIVFPSLSKTRSKKQVLVVIDAIDYKLEEAKANAVAGKNGSNFSVQFASTTYNSISIPSNLRITTNISGGGDTITFSRITGFPQNIGTITVTDSANASSTATITVGASGDISVVK